MSLPAPEPGPDLDVSAAAQITTKVALDAHPGGYRLGVQGLSAAELKHLQVLLRLVNANAARPWAIVDEGPTHAVIRPADAGPSADNTPMAVIHLGVDDDARDDALPRRFGAHHLEKALRHVEAHPVSPGAVPPPSTSAVELALFDAPPAPDTEPDTGPAPAAPTVQRAPMGSAQAAGERYRLRRWPPASLVRRDASRTRMASLLSRRALTIEEMSHSTGQSPDDCSTFVKVLCSLDLIQITAPGIPAAVAGPKLETAHRPSRGFLQGLRRRLGLG